MDDDVLAPVKLLLVTAVLLAFVTLVGWLGFVSWFGLPWRVGLPLAFVAGLPTLAWLEGGTRWRLVSAALWLVAVVGLVVWAAV